MSERTFQGVWFPKEIWLHKGLSMVEKALFIEIQSLDSSPKHCFMTNESFAEFLDVSVSTVSRGLKKLQELGWVKVTSTPSKIGSIRSIQALKPASQNDEGASQNDETPASQNDQHSIDLLLGDSSKPKRNSSVLSEQILLYLNERAKKKFRPTKSNLGFIEARLKEKYTFDDFKRVIDLKCLKWLKNPEMADYLRPSTLFSPKNFDAYLNESPVSGSSSSSSSDDSNFIDPKKQDRRSTPYIMYVMEHPEFDPEIYEEYRPNRRSNAG